jgi:hypothetical protein
MTRYCSTCLDSSTGPVDFLAKFQYAFLHQGLIDQSIRI